MRRPSRRGCTASGRMTRGSRRRSALSRRVHCRDDLDALAEGVRRSVAHAIEIWHEKRSVARVKSSKVSSGRLADAPVVRPYARRRLP